MNGREVFASAVRAMSDTMTSACAVEDLTLADIDLMIPHQANQRIIGPSSPAAPAAPPTR